MAFLESGTFTVGCNYWASHAGTNMWSDWREDVVEADLAQLASLGHQLLRVFPLWPDFQPLRRISNWSGNAREMFVGDTRRGDDRITRAGCDPVMFDRFRVFCDLAERHGLCLIVGIVTGWMSGRLYVPPALEGKNVITDPEAIHWEALFVDAFVQAMRDKPAIAAWDLGNECNCMGPAPSPHAAWCWAHTIASSIRLADPSRPVVSGMHGLRPGASDAWRMQDQGELTDFLTTHPYPEFTPNCNIDPIPEIRNTLHATAEGCIYSDIGGVPCFAEELGTLGPTNGSDATAAVYLRSALWSLWANDARALLWWCAYDQDRLEHPPYDWTGWERELGLIRSDRVPKAAAQEMVAFAKTVAALPRLPQRLTEAVCILTMNQDSWAAGHSAFILAKQAGFDLRFVYVDQPIPDASFYLVPCLTGDSGMPRHTWLALVDKARAGATVYVSHRDAIIQPFRTVFGAETVTRQATPDSGAVSISGPAGTFACVAPSGFRLHLEAQGAEVLGRHSNGAPACLRNVVGDGEIYFLNGALETGMSTTPGAFVNPATAESWRLYALMAEKHLSGRIVRKDCPFVSVTEHVVSANERLVVAVNQGTQPRTARLGVADGWTAESIQGPRLEAGVLALAGNSAAVLRLLRCG